MQYKLYQGKKPVIYMTAEQTKNLKEFGFEWSQGEQKKY